MGHFAFDKTNRLSPKSFQLRQFKLMAQDGCWVNPSCHDIAESRISGVKTVELMPITSYQLPGLY